MDDVFAFKEICEALNVSPTKDDAYFFFDRLMHEDDDDSSSEDSSSSSSSSHYVSSDDDTSSEESSEEEESVVYVAECADGKWYVGLSTQDDVIEDMYSVNAWTAVHGVRCLEKVIAVTSEFDCMLEFLHYAKLYGADNVRCAHYPDVDLPKQILRKITRLV